MPGNVAARSTRVSGEPAQASTRVPPPKPRLYHRGVRLHQRARAWSYGLRPRPAWRGVRIFGYHRVSEDDDVLSVTPRAFRAHMEELARSDVEVLPLALAVDRLGEPLDERVVCITFDDGYLDTVEHALPVLEELGLPATVFAISDVIEGRLAFDWYGPAPPAPLRAADLPRLLAAGVVDVQAHSRTHARLTALGDEQLRSEVAGSKADLERLLPYALTTFSYPAGIYGAREVWAVQEAGFRAAVTTTPGVNPGGLPLGELRRTMIYWRDGPSEFRSKLAGALDRDSRFAARLQARRAGASPSK